MAKIETPVIENHPNGFPGGSPEEVKKDYGVEIEIVTFIVKGSKEKVLAYLTDHGLEHIMD